jgi:formylglycine-generating enzyme required for sulfatase activity
LDFRAVRNEMLNEFSHWLKTGDEQAGKALDFWIARNREIDQALKAQELAGQQAWDKTRKQQQLLLDRAVLQLWREPEKAAVALHDIYGAERLRKMVAQTLQLYRCVGLPLEDAHAEERIVLPWRWEELSADTQQQLLLCGFGGADGKASRLRLDRSTGLVLSMLGGFALAGLVGSVEALWPQGAVVETRLDSPLPPEGIVFREETDKQLTLVTYKSNGFVSEEKRVDHRLLVSWERHAGKPAQQALSDDNDVAVWLLGEEKRAARPADWPNLSLAVIEGDQEADQSQRLAAFLLDTGNADRVIIGERKEWNKIYQEWRTHADQLQTSQWLFVGAKPDDLPPESQGFAYFDQTPAQLLSRLQADNERHQATEWTQSEHVQGDVILLSLKTLELAYNMTLVNIPRGQFKRGSENGFDNQKPVRTVTISNDFWMSQTEVTFEQYDAYVAAMGPKEVVRPHDKGWGRGNRPVIYVSWNDAQGYVQWLSDTNELGLQCRLPTEAEWEYAARAGSTTDYSWGDELSVSKANCRGCGSQWDGKLTTAPVGVFDANGFDLHDMHGNVWEWVQDCYADNYQSAPVDGSAWESTDCLSRVSRGGSWDSVRHHLRSAFRGRSDPGVEDDNSGFRIVCLPIER